jgi:hypothetical protein
MCIALASAEEAKQLAALVNVGLRPREQASVGSTRSPAPALAIAKPGAVPAGKQDEAPVAEPQQARGAPHAPVKPGAASATARSEAVNGAKTKQEAPDARLQAAEPAARDAASSRSPGDERKESAGRAASTAQSQDSAVPGKTVTYGYAASGRWVSESFVVGPGGNRRMAQRTYASAYILDDKPGRPPGRYLYIRNKSNKHLLFYGLGAGPQSKLEPGAEALVTLAYGPAAQTQMNQTVTLLWFDRN